LTLSFDLAKSLRNLKPDKVQGLGRRPDDQLDFADSTTSPDGPPLLLDSCVYIDVLQGGAPRFLRDLLNVRHCLHSSVCLAEMAHAFGRLDPRHKDTKATLAAIRAVIEREIPPHRVAAPDADLWCDAGILAGLLCRTKGYGKERQQACLNDALIYLQAARSGHAVVTRNVSDFDLLNQLAPRGRILLYRIVGASEDAP
jgi:predicted nucleic acid-binding protein